MHFLVYFVLIVKYQITMYLSMFEKPIHYFSLIVTLYIVA